MTKVSEETQKQLKIRLERHARGMSERLSGGVSGVIEGEEYEFDSETYPEHHVPSTMMITEKVRELYF